MNLNDDMHSGVEDLYSKYLTFADAMAAEHSALEIAAVMMAQAMSIYKTALSEEDFNNIIDVMSSSRQTVKTFTNPNLH